MLILIQILLSRIKGYVKEEKLELKWKQILDKMKILDDKYEEIKICFKNTLRDNKLNELSKIEQRSYNLKFII